MGKQITLTKIKLGNIQINSYPGGGYICSVNYSIENDDGSESFTLQSTKCTSEIPDSAVHGNATEKLSVGSDALVINFINSITTLMGDREDI